MERVKTNIDGLDEILLGGLPEFSTTLVAGAPGTGKTILCQNILYNVSKNTGRKVIYFSTISEPQIKVIRFQQQFSFFDQDYFMEKVIYHDMRELVIGPGGPGILDRASLAKEGDCFCSQKK